MFVATIISTITISSVGIMECSHKKSSEIDIENKEIAVEKISENSNEVEGERILEDVVSIVKSSNNQGNKEH